MYYNNFKSIIPLAAHNKKSILFISDKPDWAYHNIAKTWAEFLAVKYDCYIAFAEDYLINSKKFSAKEKIISNGLNYFRAVDKKMMIDASLRFSFPVHKTPPVFEITTMKKSDKKDFDIMIEMAYYFQYIAQFPFTAEKKFVGIYTDSFPHEGPSFDTINQREIKQLNRDEFYECYLKSYNGIIVGSSNLFNHYHPYTDKLVLANGIFGQDEFKPNTEVGEKEGLTIGWTGNPKRSMKGFNEVIVPAIEAVQKTGRKIRLKTKFSGPYKDLFSFYENVDLICIASEADTGPSLFAEASLSNVPSISTKIGFPKMVIKNGENGIFINRDIEELTSAIIDLYDNRQKLKYLSQNIRKDYLAVLDNKILVENLKNFLEKV